jgi:serine/threonine protein kinase
VAQGAAYSYDSDVWSLGITLLELATAAFPYPPERNGQRLSFWDLLDAIVESPPPTPPRHFGPAFHGFVLACLHKLPSERASSSQARNHARAARSCGDAVGWRDGSLLLFVVARLSCGALFPRGAPLARCSAG